MTESFTDDKGPTDEKKTTSTDVKDVNIGRDGNITTIGGDNITQHIHNHPPAQTTAPLTPAAKLHVEDEDNNTKSTSYPWIYCEKGKCIIDYIEKSTSEKRKAPREQMNDIVEKVICNKMKLESYVPIGRYDLVPMKEGHAYESITIADADDDGLLYNNISNKYNNVSNNEVNWLSDEAIKKTTAHFLINESRNTDRLSSAPLVEATKSCLNFIEDFALIGDSKKITGLINNTKIKKETTNTTIENSTDRMTLIKKYIKQISNSNYEFLTHEVKTGFTVYLPYEQHKLIRDTLGIDIEDNYINIIDNRITSAGRNTIKFELISRLKGAGVGSKDRMIVGVKDFEVMEMGMLKPSSCIKILDICKCPREIRVSLEFKTPKLIIRRSDCILYVDGV